MGKLIFKKQAGFTFIELLIVLGLIAIVLSLGYMFFGFGLRTFDRGERQTIAQQGIRSAANFITSEIRFADEIILNPEEISNADDYYYIYQLGDSVFYQDQDKNNPARILFDSISDEIAYSISFAENSYDEGIKNSLVISFTLEAEDDLYSLDTNVYILNLNDSNKYEDLSEGPAKVVKYKTP